jgi:hypothetical protein
VIADRLADESQPVVSVLLPATQPWPAVSSALESLLSQTNAVTFEVLLLDGHGGALAAAPSHPALHWLRFPGSDAFALRAAGLAAARGTIIAVTEDHCVVPADWIESIARAHGDDERAALVGPVVNHATSAVRAIDRANFLLTFAGQNRSRLAIGSRRLPVPTNVSFKRAALPAAGLAPGELEYAWLAQLRDRRALGVAPSVVLEHEQCWGAAGPAVHMASGRSYGASIRNWPWRERLRWFLMLPLLPLKLALLVAPDLLRGAGGAPASFGDVSCLALLILSNVFGQVEGAMFGAGASRKRL